MLLVLLPVQTAMVLHAVTQIASNGWRGLLWRQYVRWGVVAFFVCGCLLALGVWSFTRYVPSTPVALILLGVTPFLVKLFPSDWQPNPESRVQARSEEHTSQLQSRIPISYAVFCLDRKSVV